MCKKKICCNAILFVLYFLAAIIIVASIKSPSLINERAGVIPLCNFDAHKPFQYRILVPLLIRGIEFLTPQSIIETLQKRISPVLVRMAEANQIEKEQKKMYIVSEDVIRPCLFIGLNIVFMLLFLLLIRHFMIITRYYSSLMCDLFPLSFILIMPAFYEFPNYSYDFMHLLLFTYGLYLLYKQSWRLYMVLFPLAILNKETAAMLTIIFIFIYYRKLPRNLFLKLAVYQIFVFVIIKSVLFYVFRDNHGGFVELHLNWNLNHLCGIQNYFKFEPLGDGIFLPFYINIPWAQGINLPLLLIVTILVIYRWKRKPAFFRQATVYFPILFILAMVMGLINELRAYYDVVPIVFILSTMGFVELLGDVKDRLRGGH